MGRLGSGGSRGGAVGASAVGNEPAGARWRGGGTGSAAVRCAPGSRRRLARAHDATRAARGRSKARPHVSWSSAGSVLVRWAAASSRDGNAHQGAAAAPGADADVDAGQGEQELLPGARHARGRRGGLRAIVWTFARRRRAAARRQQGPGAGEAAIDVAGGQEPGVADLDEAAWQAVVEESAQEFDGGQRGGAVAAGAKHDGVVFDAQEARVANGYAVGVAGEVPVDLLGPPKGRLA